MAVSSVFNTVVRESVFSLLKKVSIIQNWNLRQRERKGEIIPFSKIEGLLNSANEVILKRPQKEIRVGLVKETERHPENYTTRRADWPKYERFLKKNRINYSDYDIHSSKWINDAERYDVIIWRPGSSPDCQEEALTKIYFLEKYLRKSCYPSYDELWSYENKVRCCYLCNHFSLPYVPTFITNSKRDALDYVNNTSFPLISKISNGSSSYGIIKLKSKKDAVKYINSCFSDAGRMTYWPFIRQKNYVYFQNYIHDSEYDLRIIVIGNKLFGYFRYPKSGDFRASGSGIIEKKALPEEAMRIALKTKELFKSTSLAVDMVFSREESKYYIIETSIFCGIDTPAQLVINEKAGYYKWDGSRFTFFEGRFWVQELALQEFFNTLA